ncbi:MAG: hypothetical protein PVJ21_19885 [Anaerolineales bacterium]
MKKRIPNKTEIRLVFGIIVFLVFGWAIWFFLYELPSQLLNTRWVDIIYNFMTLMATALLESIFTGIGLMVLSFLLPIKWFREGFPYKSFVTLGVMVGIIFWYRKVFINDDFFPSIDIVSSGLIIFFLVWVALLFAIHYGKPLQRFVYFLEERIEIFLYLYVPLGIIGFLTILIMSVVA